MPAPLSVSQRLARYTDLGNDGCIVWMGARHPYGYGLMNLRGRMVRAHRAAYELHHGPIPPGLIVRHTCDNPPCVNPAHLVVGTKRDNTADMLERGRHKPHLENLQPGYRGGKGADCTSAVLTWEQAREIREARGETQREIARRFGVSQRCVWAIRNGKSYQEASLR